MFEFEICKPSLHVMDDTLCDNCCASSWPALLSVSSPLSPALLSSPATAQTRQQSAAVTQRSLSQPMEIISQIWCWLGWRPAGAAMALLKFLQGTAEPCPPCQEPLAVLWAELYKMCHHPNQPLASLSWGREQLHNGVTPLLSAVPGTRETLWWSLVKHNLCESHSKGFPELSQEGDMGALSKFLDLVLWQFAMQGDSSQLFWVRQSGEWDLHLLLVLFLQGFTKPDWLTYQQGGHKKSHDGNRAKGTQLLVSHTTGTNNKSKGAEQSLNLLATLVSPATVKCGLGKKALPSPSSSPAPFTSQELSAASGQSRTWEGFCKQIVGQSPEGSMDAQTSISLTHQKPLAQCHKWWQRSGSGLSTNPIFALMLSQ